MDEMLTTSNKIRDMLERIRRRLYMADCVISLDAAASEDSAAALVQLRGDIEHDIARVDTLLVELYRSWQGGAADGQR